MNEISRFDVDLRTNLLKSSVDERVLGVESFCNAIKFLDEEGFRALILNADLRRHGRDASGAHDPVSHFTGRVIAKRFRCSGQSYAFRRVTFAN